MFSGTEIAIVLTGITTILNIRQVIKRHSVKGYYKKDTAIINDLYALLAANSDKIDPKELEKCFQDLDRADHACDDLYRFLDDFFARWNPRHIVAARKLNKRCRAAKKQCQDASNNGLKAHHRKVASDAIQARLSVDPDKLPSSTSSICTEPTSETAVSASEPTDISEKPRVPHPDSVESNHFEDEKLDELFIAFNALPSPAIFTDGWSGNDVTAPVPKPTVALTAHSSPESSALLIQISPDVSNALDIVEGRARLQNVAGLGRHQPNPGDNAPSVAPPKDNRRWRGHVVKTPNPLTDDLSKLDFSNADITSFEFQGENGVRKLTGDEAPSAAELTSLVNSAAVIEDVEQLFTQDSSSSSTTQESTMMSSAALAAPSFGLDTSQVFQDFKDAFLA